MRQAIESMPVNGGEANKSFKIWASHNNGCDNVDRISCDRIAFVVQSGDLELANMLCKKTSLS